MGIKNAYLNIDNHIFVLEGIQTVSKGTRPYVESIEYVVQVVYSNGSPVVLCFNDKDSQEKAFCKISNALKPK